MPKGKGTHKGVERLRSFTRKATANGSKMAWYLQLDVKGNLTSQFFANVYLDALDQFVKHQLKARFYIRYCDDLVLLSENRRNWREWERRIEAFCPPI